MITIDNSVLNLKLANTLLKNIQSFQTTMQRMVTGLRINKPGDDTAGFYISQKLGVQISGISTANENIQNALKILEQADGSLEGMDKYLQEIKDLVQKSTEEYLTPSEREENQKKINLLFAEAKKLRDECEYEGVNLFASSKTLDKTQTYTDGKVTIAAGQVLNRLGDAPAAAPAATTSSDSQEMLNQVQPDSGEVDGAADGGAVAAYDPMMDEGVAAYTPEETTPAYDPSIDEGNEPAVYDPWADGGAVAAYDPSMDEPAATSAYDPETETTQYVTGPQVALDGISEEENAALQANALNTTLNANAGVAVASEIGNEGIATAAATVVSSGTVNVTSTDKNTPQTITIGDKKYDVYSLNGTRSLTYSLDDAGVITFTGGSSVAIVAHDGQTDNIVFKCGNSSILDTGDENDTVTINGTMTYSTIALGAGEDSLVITKLSSNTAINAGDGNDTIINNNTARVGNFNIFAGAGDDYIEQNATDKSGRIYGEDGNDTVVGITNEVYSVEERVIDWDNYTDGGNSGSLTLNASQSKILMINGKKYLFENFDPHGRNGSKTFEYSTDANGQITIHQLTGGGVGLKMTAADGQNDNIKIKHEGGAMGQAWTILTGDGDDTITADIYSHIDSGAGNDSIVATDTCWFSSVNLGEGNDTFVGKARYIDSGTGGDSIVSNYNSTNLSSVNTIIVDKDQNDIVSGVHKSFICVDGDFILAHQSKTMDLEGLKYDIKILDSAQAYTGMAAGVNSSGQVVMYAVKAYDSVTIDVTAHEGQNDNLIANNAINSIKLGDQDDTITYWLQSNWKDTTHVNLGSGNDSLNYVGDLLGRVSRATTGGEDDTVTNATENQVAVDEFLTLAFGAGQTQEITLQDKAGNSYTYTVTNSKTAATNTLTYGIDSNTGRVYFSGQEFKVVAADGQADNLYSNLKWSHIDTGDENDTIYAPGSDIYSTYALGAGDDVLKNPSAYGLNASYIISGAGQDTITGGEGFLEDESGNDVVNGHSGRNSYRFTSTPERLTLAAGASQDITIDGKTYTVKNHGTTEATLIYGNIANQSGVERLGFVGDSFTITAADGQEDDILFAVNNGILNTGDEKDSVYNFSGLNYFKGNYSSISLGVGDDTFAGAQWGNLVVINGDEGNDSITGTYFEANGGAGNDTITWGTGIGARFQVYGGDGDDSITLSSTTNQGTSTVEGGAGNDTITINNSGSLITIDAGEGYDKVTDNTIKATPNQITNAEEVVQWATSRDVGKEGSINFAGGAGEVLQINGLKYYVKNSIGEARTLTYSTSASGQITFSGDDLYIIAANGQTDNLKLDGKNIEIYTADKADKVEITEGSVVTKLDTGADNDSVTNNGTLINLNTDAGNDTIINNNTITASLTTGAGNDYIYNNAEIKSAIQAEAGTDYLYMGNNSKYGSTSGVENIIANGTQGSIKVRTDAQTLQINGKKYTLQLYEGSAQAELNYSVDSVTGEITFSNNTGAKISITDNSNQTDNVKLYGVGLKFEAGGGNDKITVLEGSVLTSVGLGAGNDTLINYGEIATVTGMAGSDDITNNKTITLINAGADADTITNNGTVSTLNGDAGNDMIKNNGVVAGSIDGGNGTDSLYNGARAQAGSVSNVENVYDNFTPLNITTSNQTFDIGGKSYTIRAEVENVVLNYSIDETTGQITFKSNNDGNTIHITAASAQQDNILIAEGAWIVLNTGDMADYVENYGNSTIALGAGNDTVKNYGSGSFRGDLDNDILYNYGTQDSSFYGENGDDTLVVTPTTYPSLVGGIENIQYPESGTIDLTSGTQTITIGSNKYDVTIDNHDTSATLNYTYDKTTGEISFISDDSIHISAHSGQVDKVSLSGAGIKFNANDMDDIITVMEGGTISCASLGAGNDTLINNGNVTATIQGGDGDDYFYNNGFINNAFGGFGDEAGATPDTSTNDVYESGIKASANKIMDFEKLSDNITLAGSASKTIDINGKKYSVYNRDISTEGTLSYSLENGVITFTSNSNLDIVALSSQNDNVVINGSGISFDGDDLDDTINILAGNIIEGGDGNDSITNNGLTKAIETGEGLDTILNFDYLNDLDAGAGNDSISNSGTINTINAGAGDDEIENDGIIDFVYAEEGNDSIVNEGTIGDIYGGDGADTITNAANASAEILLGGSGDDILYNYSKMSTTIGLEAGNDTVWNYGTATSIDGGAGDDSIVNEGEVNYSIYGGVGADTITNAANASVGYILGDDWSGNGGNDSIVNEGEVSGYISGEDGADTIINGIDAYVSSIAGGAGADIITNYGEVGRDGIYGDAGNDSIVNEGDVDGYIYGDGGDDSIVNEGEVYGVKGGDGADTITNAANSSVGYVYGDAGNDSIVNYGYSTYAYGGEGNDYIENSGVIWDFISGDAGDDSIVNEGEVGYGISGDAGDDSIVNEGEVYRIEGGDGADTITNAANASVGYVISGDDGNDSIVNYGYSTYAYGGEGNDYIENSGVIWTSISGDAGDDTVVNNAGGVIIGASLGAGNDVLYNYGEIDENISGDAGNDSIYNYGKVESTIYGQNSWETDTHLNDYLFVGANSSVGGFGAGSIDAAQAANKITQIETIEVEGGLKTITIAADTTTEIEVVGADGKTYKYTIKNRDTGASTTLSYGLNGDGQIVFNSENGKLNITAFSGQKDNVVVDGQNIYFDAGDLDDTIVVEAYGYASYITGGEGNDSIVNEGNVGIISGEIGNDSIVNEGEVDLIEGGDGADTIINSINSTLGYAHGDEGDDSIVNEGKVFCIYGDDGNDSIVNSGEAGGIFVNDGFDTIINEAYAYASYIEGGADNDTITNYGEVGRDGILGNAGDDSIYNYGKVEGAIYGQDPWHTDTHLNDYLFVGANSSVGGFGAGSIDAAQAANKITQFETLEIEGGLKTINIGKKETKEIEVVGADGKTYKYTIKNRDTGASTTLSYGLNGDGQIEFNSESGQLDITAFSGQKDNVVVDGQYINFNAGDLDDTIVIYNASIAYAGAGNDSIINEGYVDETIYGDDGADTIINAANASVGGYINGGAGDDSIVNNGTVEYDINGGDGADTIINAANESVGGISGDEGNDSIVNYGYSTYAYGGEGNDYIENSGAIWNSISGYEGDDSIVNNGTVEYDIYGGDGADTITNTANASVGYCIDGDEGDDSIVNEGDVRYDIYGDAGDDSIVNEGEVRYDIYGDAGDDSIVNGGSVYNGISGGEGNDIVTNEKTGVISSSVYLGAGDDILYNYGEINDFYGESIVTEDGKDSVFNYGTVSGSINTGADNDYILIASDNNELNAGDGNDSVFLNGNYNVAYAGQGDDETTIMGNNNFAYGEDGSGGTGVDKVIATGSNNTYSEMNELLGGVETEFSVVTDYKMNDESLYDIKFSAFLPDIELDVSSTENAQNTLEQLNQIIESITQSRAKIGMQSTLLKEHLDSNIVKLENLENSCSIIRDADTADEYNKLISQATMIEQIQALQAQASSNHYNLLSTLISSVAS